VTGVYEIENHLKAKSNIADQADNGSLKVKQVRNFVVYYIKYWVISHL